MTYQSDVVTFEGIEHTTAVESQYSSPVVQAITPYNVDDILRRPVQIAHGTGGSTVGNIPFTGGTNGMLFVDYALLNRTFGLSTRFAGAYGLTLDLEFTLDVVATPFQNAIMKLSLQPGIAGNPAADWMRLTNPALAYHLPGAMVCTSCATTGSYVAKYVSSADVFEFDSTNAFWSLGLNNLITPNLPPNDTVGVSWRIFLSIVDVRPVGATIPPSEYTKVALQSGLTTHSRETRSISPALMAFSKVAKVVYQGIPVPLISSYGRVASWAAKILSNAAYAMGWSKPLDVSGSKRMHVSNINYLMNYDGPDHSYNLGASVENEVVPLPGFAGSDLARCLTAARG
jgi:hypothetical protein